MDGAIMQYNEQTFDEFDDLTHEEQEDYLDKMESRN